jgi:hypothetical protein
VKLVMTLLCNLVICKMELRKGPWCLVVGNTGYDDSMVSNPLDITLNDGVYVIECNDQVKGLSQIINTLSFKFLKDFAPSGVAHHSRNILQPIVDNSSSCLSVSSSDVRKSTMCMSYFVFMSSPRLVLRSNWSLRLKYSTNILPVYIRTRFWKC